MLKIPKGTGNLPHNLMDTPYECGSDTLCAEQTCSYKSSAMFPFLQVKSMS